MDMKIVDMNDDFCTMGSTRKTRMWCMLVPRRCTLVGSALGIRTRSPVAKGTALAWRRA